MGISEIASIGSFLSPTSWVVSCLLLVIWITTTIPSKKGMWRNESPFLHIPFLLCFHLVQGSRFRVEVAASPQLYMGDARSRIILAPSSGRGRRAKRGGVGILACENTASRANLRPFGAPPSKGRREKSGVRWLVPRAQGSRGGFPVSMYEAMTD